MGSTICRFDTREYQQLHTKESLRNANMISKVTFYLIYTGVKSLFGCHSGSVWMRSYRFYKTILLPEPWTRPKVRFGPWCELWTGLQSGSQKFRFKLWFRTELRHHYFAPVLAAGPLPGSRLDKSDYPTWRIPSEQLQMALGVLWDTLEPDSE